MTCNLIFFSYGGSMSYKDSPMRPCWICIGRGMNGGCEGIRLL